METPAQVVIDGLPYNVVTSDKSDQAVFGPRFGSGAEDETDLTLLKSLTFEAGSNGSLTPPSPTDELIPYLISGGRYNPIGYLEKMIAPELVHTQTTGSTALNRPTASAFWQGEYLVAYRVGGTNYMFRYSVGNGWASVSIPSSLSNAEEITSFSEKNDVLFIATAGTSGIWYINTSFTVTKVPTGSSTWKLTFNLNSKMYLVSMDNNIREYTGDTSAMSATLIAKLYYDRTIYSGNFPTDTLNGRQYFGSPTGLLAFDGVRVYTAVPVRGESSTPNFTFVRACAGYLFTNMGNSLYRFNSASLERLYDFPIGTKFVDAIERDGVLYLLTEYGNDYLEGQKGTTHGGDYGYRLWSYDGTDLYLLDEQVVASASDIFMIHFDLGFTWHGIMVAFGLEKVPATVNSVYFYEYGFLTDETTDPLILSFRENSQNLPSVNKIFEGYQLIFQEELDLETGTDDILIYYRFSENDDWTLCKTVSATNAYLYRGDFDVSIDPTKRIFFKAEINGTQVKFKSITFFYRIVAPYKAQWNLMLNPASNNVDDPDAYLATYLTKIEGLRASQEVFDFIDVNGTTYSVILDSFNQRVVPAYNPDEGEVFESQITVVLREV